MGIRLARERRAHSDGNEKLSTAERLSFPLFVANLPANTPSDQVEGTPRGFSDEDDAPQPSGKCANALLGPWSIQKRLWMLAVQVFLIFTVTLSLFPGQVAALPFNHHSDSKWFQLRRRCRQSHERVVGDHFICRFQRLRLYGQDVGQFDRWSRSERSPLFR